MKSVLMSIKPQWCEKIANGEKTVEIRKTKPKIDTPFKVYIYCTQEKRLLHKFNKGERIDEEHYFEEDVFVRRNTWVRGHLNPNGKVIGEFVCDWIRWEPEVSDGIVDVCLSLTSCVDAGDIIRYANGKMIYSWHISNLVIYNTPKQLNDFKHCGVNYHFSPPLTKPPQSWCYVEEHNAKDHAM